ncbi:hypothetical protein BS78_K178200 [Paspalum vaginatum]|uniref:F-box domain-containing protein n=1 Tax=Paspalum vaginatum TaxID=158149 RepID=A0A9W7XBQ1_9POAL|nr:hypothetical protein BS78_K178200 [Paspalum vaginatum]
MASYSDLPVHLLEEILLRIDDAADLVRTSAACVSFRRIVTDGRFRRRFRLLHRPSVLGFLGCCTGRPLNFYPVAPPNRSAPAARALAQAADFSFSLLPDYSTGNNWWLSDIRDGRFLLSRLGWSRHVFEPFVVYDPLHRQKVKIPPIPNDLLVVESPPGHGGVRRQAQDLEPFLLPAAAASNGEDHRGDPSFQLMCIVLFKDSEHAALVYSSATGKWRVMATLRNASCDHVTWWFYARRHYAHGCFYWVFYNETAMIKLDTHQMKFSIVDLPTCWQRQQGWVVDSW